MVEQGRRQVDGVEPVVGERARLGGEEVELGGVRSFV